jgi:hypothetical protein
MFRKPLTWLVLTALFCGSVVFIGRFFGLAFPIVNVTITMDRHAALAAGDAVCARLQLPPEGGRHAAVFRLDDAVRNYVELEAGGATAFQAMLQEGLYMPYQWAVRRFRQHEVRESVVRFTPQGVPYGFMVQLPENAPGPVLKRVAAQALAERAAAADWGVTMTNFNLVEASQEIRPGGRVDHTFVYERPNVMLDEARYRLRLVVAGDRVTELTQFIKIPEGFTRRYEQMRSANTLLATVAQAIIYIVYFFGGCGIGLFFLVRQRRVLWSMALLWALLIAVINATGVLNAFPLAWAGYDTTDSYGVFRAQLLTQSLLAFLQYMVLFGISFVAAEGLDRKAFGHHIQPWRLWSGGVANSATVLGQTIGGYYLAGIFLACVIGFYVLTTRWLGWWNPSDALSDPNVLGQYCPWLASALALSPGFWEECLFRAVPLGCAALIGERLGRRKTALAIVCVLQAIVFGAGHASYPAQPAYARIVELTLTFTAFGLIYLRFGLLPVIIAHFVVDAAAFSLPVFVSSAPGMWVNKVVCVALMAVPLAVPLLWWAVRRRLEPVPAQAYNAAWQPPPAPARTVAAAPSTAPRALGRTSTLLVLAAGVAGVLLWLFCTEFRSPAGQLTVDRRAACNRARAMLAERSIALTGDWHTLALVPGRAEESERYVWQECGTGMYARLLEAAYLAPPRWQVRMVRFTGDVAERAEEHDLRIGPRGDVLRVRHALPEARAGARLSEKAARAVARTQVPAPASFAEVSAVASRLPNRTDWEFTYRDTTVVCATGAEARVGVTITGDRVGDRYRYFHVPEEWRRAESARATVRMLVMQICMLVLTMLFLVGLIVGIVRWARGEFAWRHAALFAAVFVVLAAARTANNWPATMAEFVTAKPLSSQVLQTMLATLIGMILAAITGGVLAGASRASGPTPRGHGFVMAAATAFLAAGLQRALAVCMPAALPVWPTFDAAASVLPLLAPTLATLLAFLLHTAFLLFVYSVVERISAGGTRRRSMCLLLLLVLGIILSGRLPVDTIHAWLAGGLLLGGMLWLGYAVVFRFNRLLVPFAYGIFMALTLVPQITFAAYPGARAANLIAVAVVLVMAWRWSLSGGAGRGQG